MIVIPKNFKKASLRKKAHYLLLLVCSVIFVAGDICLDLIVQVSNWIKIVYLWIIDGQSNRAEGKRLAKDEEKDLTQIQNQIQKLKLEEAKLLERFKDLQIRIGWSMDYIQLSKDHKDTDYLDQFRDRLEKNLNSDEDEPDPQDNDNKTK